MQAKISIVWNGDTKGPGNVQADHFVAPIAIPAERGGSGEGTDPKTLLLASAASCYTMNLTAILQHRKLPVTTITVNSEVLDPKSGEFSIRHQIDVRLSSTATGDQVNAAQSAFEAADRACTIGNLLKKAGAEISVACSVSVA